MTYLLGSYWCIIQNWTEPLVLKKYNKWVTGTSSVSQLSSVDYWISGRYNTDMLWRACKIKRNSLYWCSRKWRWSEENAFWIPSCMDISIIEFLKAGENEVLWGTVLWSSLVMPKDVAEMKGKFQNSQDHLGCSAFE